LRADADLGAEAELKAVGKARGDIDIDTGGINLLQERFGSFEAFVEQALGIDQEKRARLQEMYLEG
jgi:hypothetical protein